MAPGGLLAAVRDLRRRLRRRFGAPRAAAATGGPPAHWVERVRRGAPGLLEPGGGEPPRAAAPGDVVPHGFTEREPAPAAHPRRDPGGGEASGALRPHARAAAQDPPGAEPPAATAWLRRATLGAADAIDRAAPAASAWLRRGAAPPEPHAVDGPRGVRSKAAPLPAAHPEPAHAAHAAHGDGPLTVHAAHGDGPLTVHAAHGDGPLTVHAAHGDGPLTVAHSGQLRLAQPPRPGPFPIAQRERIAAAEPRASQTPRRRAERPLPIRSTHAEPAHPREPLPAARPGPRGAEQVAAAHPEAARAPEPGQRLPEPPLHWPELPPDPLETAEAPGPADALVERRQRLEREQAAL